jgi:site-specific DNA-cytosine methylase
MSKAIRDSITETFGFEPICINSALLSAQNRQRLYWVGKRNADGTYSKVEIEQPEDRGILLKDILEGGEAWREKSYCIDANYFKGGNLTNMKKQSGSRLMAAEPIAINTTAEGDKARTLMAGYYKYGTATLMTNPGFTGGTTAVAEPVNVTADGKAHTIKAQYYKNGTANFVTNAGFDATAVAEPVSGSVGNMYEKQGQNGQLFSIDGKSKTLSAGTGVSGRGIGSNNAPKVCIPVAEPVGIGYRGRMEDGKWVKRFESDEQEKANALTTAQTDSMVSEPIRVGCMPSPSGELRNSQAFRVYSTEGKSVNLLGQGGGAEAKTGLYAIQCCPMRVKEATKKGYTEIEPMDCVDMTQPNSKTRRGRNMADKSNCLMTSCDYWQYCGCLGYATPCEWDEEGRPTKAVSVADGKVYAVYEVKDGKITIKGKQYPIKLVDGDYIIRKLTVRECMRLQTVPEWYEFPVSDSQAYKMLGNGWTVDVIAHLLESILREE